MLPQARAKTVVLSNQQEVVDQIFQGADKLRQAAATENGKELARVLSEFEEELDSKFFSAASIDKQILGVLGASKARQNDKEVVKAIMREFVAHLQEHWQEEAVKQRERNTALQDFFKAAMEYALGWEKLTSMYSQRIRRYGDTNARWKWPLPFLAIFASPLLLVLALFSVDYNELDTGFHADLLFNFFCFPLVGALVAAIFPHWLYMSGFRNIGIKMAFSWVIFVGVLEAVVLALLSWVFDTHPVPYALFIPIGIPWLCSPGLWLATRQLARHTSGTPHRFALSSFSFAVVCAVFGAIIPFYKTVLDKADPIPQVFGALGLVVLRVLLEKICGLCAVKLGFDLFPFVIALSMFAYELAVCSLLTSLRWFAILIVLAADILENSYYQFALFREHNRCIAREREGDIRRVSKKVSRGSTSMVASVLLLRELVEVLVPMQFLVMLSFLFHGPARSHNDLVDHLRKWDGRESFFRLLVILILKTSLKAVAFVVSCLLLRKKGVTPFWHLRGLLAADLASFVTLANSAVVYFMMLQHSHFGCDLTFTLHKSG